MVRREVEKGGRDCRRKVETGGGRNGRKTVIIVFPTIYFSRTRVNY